MPPPRELHLVAATPEDTREIGAVLAGALRRGDVVVLTGELGAGKTCLVQGAARALGVRGRVTSPSFVLRRDYAGTVPVLHLDIYRLDRLGEVLDLGYDEVLDGSHVTFIEWGDAMSPLLPGERLEVELGVEVDASAAVTDVEARRIVVRPHGDDWMRRVADLSAALQPWTRPSEET